jgi:hypothetical protein
MSPYSVYYDTLPAKIAEGFLGWSENSASLPHVIEEIYKYIDVVANDNSCEPTNSKRQKIEDA